MKLDSFAFESAADCCCGLVSLNLVKTVELLDLIVDFYEPISYRNLIADSLVYEG